LDDTGTTPLDLPRGDRVKGVFVGLGVAALAVGFALVGFLAFNSWQTVHDVQNAQSNHAETLNAIKAEQVKLDTLANEIHQFQIAQGQGNTTVGQILREAGAEVAALQASQHAICVAVHANC
jgi:hypothetical protein